MAATQSYDYSLTVDHIQPFQYADPDMAFLEEDADSYGDLWQFKPHITQYTFGIAKQQGNVFLKYKIEDIPQFYTWNIKEKVENIEDHREHFIVIVLRAVDDSGNATSHNHSIVTNVRHQHGKFDIVTLMDALQGTDIESLNKDFISKQLLPWQCRAPLLEESPQHHGHKGDPGVTPGTCGAIGKRAQVILVWVRAPGRWKRLPPTETRSHED